MTAKLNDKLYYGSTELAEVQNITSQSIDKMVAFFSTILWSKCKNPL